MVEIKEKLRRIAENLEISEEIKKLKETAIEDINNKKCSKCKVSYPATPEFYHRNRTKKGGLDSWCKQCKKEYNFMLHKKKRYGVTETQFLAILKKQDNKCAICGKKFTKTYPLIPYLDHDHATLKNRAFLCVNCNFIIGNSKENPLILIKTVFYLKQHKAKFKK